MAVSLAAQARSETLTMARPGGTIQLFWEPVTTTSRPQPSVSKGTAPMPLMPSTMMSAFGAVPWMMAASSASGLVTPVEVSL